MKKNLAALAIMAGLSSSLGQAMAPRQTGPVSNYGLRLLDGSPSPVPLMARAGKPGKGRNKHPRHPSARYVAQDKRDARKARNCRG